MAKVNVPSVVNCPTSTLLLEVAPTTPPKAAMDPLVTFTTPKLLPAVNASNTPPVIPNTFGET